MGIGAAAHAEPKKSPALHATGLRNAAGSLHARRSTQTAAGRRSFEREFALQDACDLAGLHDPRTSIFGRRAPKTVGSTPLPTA
jgi:hypothetical protein